MVVEDNTSNEAQSKKAAKKLAAKAEKAAKVNFSRFHNYDHCIATEYYFVESRAQSS